MLSADEWLAQAQALPEGGRGRVDHVCGGGRTLLLSHNRDDWSAFCFRCDDHGFERKPDESWQDRLARMSREREHDDKLATQVELPSPANFEVGSWPAPARVWLYKAGIGLPEIEQLGAYWHEESRRVVLPIMEGDAPIYWQARDPTWTRSTKRPKYVNPQIDKQHLVAKYGQGDLLVLTEDVLSAFRVGQVTEAWSILGTKLSTHVAGRIAEGRPVAVWLDPDPAGRKAGRDIVEHLRSMGHPALRIDSRADPKLLSRREIEQWLQKSRHSLQSSASGP